MPTYLFKCPKCGEFDRFMRMSEHVNVTECPECGRLSKQVITAPSVFVQPECHYESPIDGRPITNHRERLNDMARNGCIEYDPEMRKDADRRQQQADAALDKSIDESVEREISGLSGSELETLGKSLETNEAQTMRL